MMKLGMGLQVLQFYVESYCELTILQYFSKNRFLFVLVVVQPLEENHVELLRRRYDFFAFGNGFGINVLFRCGGFFH